ncbi:hypothetical protein [Treponema pedis]|nr:hypothetical protein [Treponema pedis]
MMTMKKRLLYVALIAVSVIGIVTCTFSVLPTDLETSNTVSLSRTVDMPYLSEQAYMGGSVLYNPDNPSGGHLVKGAVIAVRFGTVAQRSEEDAVIYTDNADDERFGILKVLDVDSEKLGFSVVLFDKNGGQTQREYKLAVGEQADINGDGVNDIHYYNPKTTRAGFENALYLTFLSSKEKLVTTMFAVIVEQYGGSYPSGLIGINPDGKFIYSKYEPNSTTRAVVYGLSDDDFVLDSEAGSYFKTANVSQTGSARAVEDKDIVAEPVSVADVLPLASWTASRAKGNGLPSVAESYEDYLKEKERIDQLFKKYKTFVEIPMEHFQQELSKYQNVSLDTSIGLHGRFVISWSHIEADLMAGVYVSGKIDIRLGEAITQNLAKIGPYSFENSYTFAIGPVPVTVACPVTFEMPIDLKLEGPDSQPFVIATTALYGAGIAVGADINWNKFLTRDFVKPFANPYAITEGVFYMGRGEHVSLDDKRLLALSISASPSVSAKPNIGIASTVWTGLEGVYKLPAAFTVSIKEDRTFSGFIKLSHEGAINWVAGIKIAGFQKEFKPTLFKIGPAEIQNLELFSVKPF